MPIALANPIGPREEFEADEERKIGLEGRRREFTDQELPPICADAADAVKASTIAELDGNGINF
jgi:hypothetical protein